MSILVKTCKTFGENKNNKYFCIKRLIMSFNEWINNVISTGNLCFQYAIKVKSAMSKKELMDIVLDANGVSFLLDMQEKNMELPYETITDEFRSYINGRYIGVFNKCGEFGYTSKIYCCYSDSQEILADTTALVLLGCTNRVVVPENSYVRIYLDKNCDIELHCPKSSNALIEYSDGALIGIGSHFDNVKLINRKYATEPST